jgi:DNA-binding GntR family transcriptional regulator
MNLGPLAERMAQNAQARPQSSARPRLNIDTVPEYLDWLMDQTERMHSSTMDHHMKAVELIIRRQGNEAQAKATQHTLVEDGVIAPPPQAS